MFCSTKVNCWCANKTTKPLILTSKKLTWIKISVIIALFLYLSNLNLQKERLNYILSNNKVLNSFQSAYIKHHSSETTLISVHDHNHIIKVTGHQQVTCLTLLDLSAAFDTIDHTFFSNVSLPGFNCSFLRPVLSFQLLFQYWGQLLYGGPPLN